MFIIRRWVKALYICTIVALLLMQPVFSTAADYRTLEMGMSGDDVLQLKLRMAELGYFDSLEITDVYDDLMAERILWLQAVNGLTETGIVSAALQTCIYSDACLAAHEIITDAPQILIATPAPAAASPQPTPDVSLYHTLQTGDAGPEVQQLKLRMYALGYYRSENVSDVYNDLMAERIMWLQRRNGLEETGIATPQLQALIYSGSVAFSRNTPTPSPAPAPTPAPLPIEGPKNAVVLPELTQEGFLLPDAQDDPFIFKDVEDGHCIYISGDLSVEISRLFDPNLTLVWYETEIKVRNGEKLTSYLNPKTSKAYRFSTPEALAEKNNTVLAFTDDFFGYRMYNKQITGIVIRNGEIISDKTYKTRDAWPPLDTLAVFADGSMKTFGKNEHTAQEYLDMGAEQVFAFGPILVQNGEMGERIQDETYYHYREPRCALGMIEPGHYLVLTANGRTDNSKGAYLSWLAERMMQRGVTEALNLDGGGTTALIFLGQHVNADGTGQNTVRSVTSIIGFGSYEPNGE